MKELPDNVQKLVFKKLNNKQAAVASTVSKHWKKMVKETHDLFFKARAHDKRLDKEIEETDKTKNSRMALKKHARKNALRRAKNAYSRGQLFETLRAWKKKQKKTDLTGGIEDYLQNQRRKLAKNTLKKSKGLKGKNVVMKTFLERL